MVYVINAGGVYKGWETPRWLSKINGEVLIERTIRLLKENGVTDIYISSNSDMFDYIGEKRLVNVANSFIHETKTEPREGYWIDAFAKLTIPVTYLYGDVYYSDECIKKIVETPTDDILFFGAKKQLIKNWPEPFAFKVVNTQKFFNCIAKVKYYHSCHKFRRPHPISWDLWNVINGAPLDKGNFYGPKFIDIKDYTCDVDSPNDIAKIEASIK